MSGSGFGRPVVIYGVRSDGQLVWLRHNGPRNGDGLQVPGAWIGPDPVGTGWSELEAVFNGGEGAIYRIPVDGILKWFFHNGWQTGDGLDVPGAWSSSKDVGRGW